VSKISNLNLQESILRVEDTGKMLRGKQELTQTATSEPEKPSAFLARSS